jgi:hypothetical protein
MKSGSIAVAAAAFLSGLVALQPAPASAAPVIAAGAGLTAPTNTIDFSEIALADDTVLTGQFAGLGVAFSGFYYNGCAACVTTPPSGVKPDISNFFANNTVAFNSLVSMSFDTVVSDAVFELAFNTATLTVTSFLGAAQVETFSLPSASTWGIYGFTGSAFDRIEISHDAALLLDNLQFNTAQVPEAGTLALLGAGLAGLGFARRRKAG